MTIQKVAEQSQNYLIKSAESMVSFGYKQTEVGVIPNDWDARQLKELFVLKNGYSFKGEYFSNKGPIVLTPGNFKLEGGLYFEARNTKRYEAPYPKMYEFEKGDMVVVMTDLTPDCNLLGKPAFVEVEEKILHNQRIGKIAQLSKNWDKKFLYYSLLSPSYLSTIKNAATGSTVRHTSPTTIGGAWIAVPSLKEQTTIATALSDVDSLIGELEKLITKKQAIKTATMQQLLTGRTRLPQFALREDGSKKGYKQSELGNIPEDWSVNKIGDLSDVIRGASPRPKGDKRYYGGAVPRLMVEDVTRDGKFVIPSIDSLTEAGAKLSRPCSAGTLTIVCSGTVGVPSILAVDACIHDGFLALTKVSKKIRIDYLYHFFSTQRDKFNNSATHGGVFTNLTTKGVREFLVALPVSIEEQTAITTILSDMDEELQVLEQRLNKTRQIKQGMMQELLTGKTRLPFEVNDQQGLGL